MTSENLSPPNESSLTLDPPGSIAVVGAGPLGIEAALYGRYLGYDVTVLERREVGHSLTARRDEPLPMLPDRCLSPLAKSALEAQSADSSPRRLPETISEWIDDGLIALTESDLLAGRVRVPADVTRIELVDASADGDKPADPDDPSGEVIPPDFQLTVCEGAGEALDEQYEAVILAIGSEDPPQMKFTPPQPYLFRIGESGGDDDEQKLRSGLREIVAIYAQLADREQLDLYRPARL